MAVDGTPVWLLLLLLLVAETFTAPFDAAHRAVVPDVLPDPRECLVGTGLLRVLYQVDQVAGILAAGVVIVLVGERAGLMLDVVSFLVSAIVLGLSLRWRPASREPGEHTTLIGDFRAGWRLVFDDPSMRALVLLGWSAAVFLVAPEAVALAYARDQGAEPVVGAALMASLPAGAAIGAWVVGRLEPLRQVRLIVPLAVTTCLPLMVTSLAPPWQVVLPLWFLSGAAQGFMVPLMTTVNLVSPPAMRGRVNGLAGAGFSTVTAAAFLLSGAVADLATPAVAVTAAAVLGLALVGVAHRSWPHGGATADRDPGLPAGRLTAPAGDTHGSDIRPICLQRCRPGRTVTLVAALAPPLPVRTRGSSRPMRLARRTLRPCWPPLSPARWWRRCMPASPAAAKSVTIDKRLFGVHDSALGSLGARRRRLAAAVGHRHHLAGDRDVAGRLRLLPAGQDRHGRAGEERRGDPRARHDARLLRAGRRAGHARPTSAPARGTSRRW